MYVGEGTYTHTHTHTVCEMYIYAFSRCFYPKRLTVHSGYTFFISMCVPWELNPQPFALLTQCSTTEPQEHDVQAKHFFYWEYMLTKYPSYDPKKHEIPVWGKLTVAILWWVSGTSAVCLSTRGPHCQGPINKISNSVKSTNTVPAKKITLLK